MACKPGFVFHPLQGGDGYSSGMIVTNHLVRPTRTAQRGKPLPGCCHPDAQPLFGLAPGGVYPATSVAGSAVRSYRTISPLPVTNDRRYHFCGTFPGVASGGRYPPPFSVEPGLSSKYLRIQQPSGHLVGIEYRNQAPEARSISDSRRDAHSTSHSPLMLFGRKCRWKAITTFFVYSSHTPLTGTS